MPKIDVAQVQYVANLARLHLDEAEKEMFRAQLDDILTYIDKLGELDTGDVEPMAHVMGLKDVFRDDAPGESLPAETAVANAPSRTKDSFKVPKVIG